MDLVTLGTNFQPAKMVENYDSLIWTERFNTVGEFQITSGDVDKFMELLPEGTFLSLRESNVPMIVETHQIDRKKNTPANLIIKGRAFESILDRRVSVQALAGGTTDWNVVAKIPADVAYYIIKKIVIDGVLSANDVFPNVTWDVPGDYLTSTGPNRSFTVPRGKLLTAVLQFLQTEAKADPSTTPATPVVEQHGIRGVRPNIAGTNVAMQIYTGTDRSGSIYFDATRQLLDDGSYLFSKVASADTAVILGSTTAVMLNKGTSATTGFNRRVTLVDGTTSGVSDETALVEQGKVALAESAETALFDGTINQDISPYTYGVDYFLGDIVRLVGDYTMDKKARVTEYIRAEDRTGIKSYPTLTTIA